MLVLRSAAASPFARKVRIAAAVLGLEDRIEISAADTNDPGRFAAAQNPLGKIPALILETGEAIFDSAVIVEYLDWLAGGGKIIPSEPKARFRSLTQAGAGGRNRRGGGAHPLRDRLARAGARAPRNGWPIRATRSPARFAPSRPAPPEELSDVGTIALACALGYLDLRFEGAWRAEHPRLVAWLDVFSEATPSFEATRFRG